MANGLSKEQVEKLARLGAMARLAELESERKEILRAFPGLAAQAARQQKAVGGGESPTEAPEAKPRKTRRRKLSKEQRKAQSERMTRIWAERRKAAQA